MRNKKLPLLALILTTCSGLVLASSLNADACCEVPKEKAHPAPEPEAPEASIDGSCCEAPVGEAEEPHQHQALEAADQDLPASSLFHLESTWRTQADEAFQLRDLGGRPALIAMIFTRCGYACPRIVSDLKSIEAELSEKNVELPRLVLVSMDPAYDTPEVLREYAEEHDLDPEHWILLHGDTGEIRELAAVLGVSYRQQKPGQFAHSNRITLLNPVGEKTLTIDGLGGDATPLLNRFNRED